MLISLKNIKFANLFSTKSERFRKSQTRKQNLIKPTASTLLKLGIIDEWASPPYFAPMESASRRKHLIERMKELENSGLNCRDCQGTCCTYEANSMMVTPVEAFELYSYLKAQGQFDQELKTRLEENIRTYRLDQSLGNGKKSFLRRTYTCPFFNHKELGCPLPVEVKPFGCLAFNAHHEKLKASEFCFSEKEILQRREEDFQEIEAKENEELKKKYNLFWDKVPLPVALLDFFKLTVDDQE